MSTRTDLEDLAVQLNCEGVTVLQAFAQFSKKCVCQCCNEISVPKAIVQHILWHEKCKRYV
jgi:hypothetical protein